MEGPAKERLTGALILIAALIIVVPEMLSGPDSKQPASGDDAEAGPPLRTYQLQLDTPSAVRSEDQSALSPKPAQPEPEAPVATVEPQAAQPVAQAAPAQPVTPSKPAEEKPVAKSPVEKPPVEIPAADKPASPAAAAASTGNWWAQLGSFSGRENADRLARQLRAAGYQVSVSPSKSNGKELFRVRAGPVASREAAVALQSRLAAAGHKSALVAP